MSGSSASRLPQPRRGTIEKGFGTALALVTLLWLLSASTRPVADGRLNSWAIAIITFLLAAHATLYFAAESLRARFGWRGYVAGQAGALSALALFPHETLLALFLFIAFSAQLGAWHHDDGNWPWLTVAVIALFGISTSLSSGIYRGATVALVLAIISLLLNAFTPRHSAELVDAPSPARPVQDERGLTDRELQVLRLAAAGSRSKEIAARLGITERTVKSHLAAAYRKLGVDSRAAAAARASQLGLL